MLLGVLQ